MIVLIYTSSKKLEIEMKKETTPFHFTIVLKSVKYLGIDPQNIYKPVY